MRMLLAPFLALTLTAAAAPADSGITGKWISEREVGDADGKTYRHVSTITLKEEAGGVLTGTIVQTSDAPWMKAMTGKSNSIRDGKIEGSKFVFKLVIESPSGDRTSIYEGTLQGDELKGVVKFRGIGQTWDLIAKRAPTND